MDNTIPVVCENLGITLDVAMGTPLTKISDEIAQGSHPFLAAMVNNRLKELTYKIYEPVSVRMIDITSFEGIRVYQRTAWFILQKAVQDIFPQGKLHIRHSLGDGFYCEIEGMNSFSEEECQSIERRMRELVMANLPIYSRRLLTTEVRESYLKRGFTDKIELLDTRPRLYSHLYSLDDTVGYFYGSLTPTTGYITLFKIRPFYNGFQLALPTRTSPDVIQQEVKQDRMFEIFHEYQNWVSLMGVPTIGAVNARILEGVSGGMIMMAEAFHERKFAAVADAIMEANLTKGTRVVLISGPSSSGKTTSAKRLAIQLGVLGLKPELISLDDYFVNREDTPKDADGEYDYEALEAIDLKLFNEHLKKLMQGESVDIPRYDFITGRRSWHNAPLTLSENSILIIEGIHGLNPKLTPSIPDALKFKIYISCFTSVAMDNLTRISTTDNRLLRRLTRDYRQRGANAIKTLSMWASVRRGEEKHIFPYQENADVMFNSSLFYEISVLKPFAEKILREVPDTLPEYNEARRMLKFLDNFIPISTDNIPPTSILREFVGGSTFEY